MMNPNKKDKLEYLYLILAEKFSFLAAEHKISHLEKLAGDTFKQTVKKNIDTINQVLSTNLPFNPAHAENLHSNNNQPLHSSIYTKRLFHCFYGSLNNTSPTLDIRELNVSAPFYPLFIGMVYAHKKEKQNWNIYRTTAIDVACELLNDIHNNEHNKPYSADFKVLTPNTLKPFYECFMNYLFSDELFALVQVIELKIKESSFLDNYNWQLLLNSLTQNYLYTTSGRDSFYQNIKDALSNSTSDSILDEFANNGIIFYQELETYRQYQNLYLEHTPEMLISEIQKTE